MKKSAKKLVLGRETLSRLGGDLLRIPGAYPISGNTACSECGSYNPCPTNTYNTNCTYSWCDARCDTVATCGITCNVC